MKNDAEIVELLIKRGVVGATLGALLTKNNGEGMAGALAVAAILATYKASEKAVETRVPMYVEENGSLYMTQPDGIKKFIRKIEKPGITLQQNFKLK